MNEHEELKRKRDAVRELLDKTINHFRETLGRNFGDYHIFMEVYGDTPLLHEKRREFSTDVANCPQEVMSWCKKQLSPKTTRNQKQSRGTRFVRKGGKLCRVRVVQGTGYAFRTKP